MDVEPGGAEGFKPGPDSDKVGGLNRLSGQALSGHIILTHRRRLSQTFQNDDSTSKSKLFVRICTLLKQPFRDSLLCVGDFVG